MYGASLARFSMHMLIWREDTAFERSKLALAKVSPFVYSRDTTQDEILFGRTTCTSVCFSLLDLQHDVRPRNHPCCWLTDPCLFAIPVCLEEIQTGFTIVVMPVQAVHGRFRCVFAWAKMASNQLATEANHTEADSMNLEVTWRPSMSWQM